MIYSLKFREEIIHNYLQNQSFIGVLRKRLFWKYAANLLENIHAEV